MGVAYYIVLDREIAGLDTFVDGKAIAHQCDELAAITRELGLRDINEFVSADPEELIAMAAEMDVDLPEPPAPEAWFAAEEGLHWIAQIQNYLTAHPDALGDGSAVLEDLEGYRTLLEAAKANDARWHFAVDF